MVAVGLFIVSMSILLLIFNQDPNAGQELKTNIVDSISLKSHQEEEKSYREIVHSQEDPVVVIGINGLVDFISWDFEAATGYKKEDLKGQLFFSLVHTDDLATFLSGFGKVIESETPLNTFGPYRIKDAGGEYHFNIGSIYPISGHGKVLKVAITTRDITVQLQKEKDSGQKAQPKKETQTAKGKKIRDQQQEDETRLMVDKLASAN